MPHCQVADCPHPVSKPGHTLCLDHWKAQRNGQLPRCPTCHRLHDNPASPLCRTCTPSAPAATDTEDPTPANLLSSTRIAQHFNLTPAKVNLILAELGWIEKYVKGWVPTDRGNALGANVKEMRNGTPYVLWPPSLLGFPPFLESVKEQLGSPPFSGVPAGPRDPRPSTTPTDPSADFRSRFPATLRTQDGHMVRSRAEVLIDNWLYMQGLVHAYERRLPIEEECYCDFYLPRGKGLYIEFWGRESDPKYRARQAAKRALYVKYNLRLIELADPEIERLDDVLPRMLLRFGIEST